VAFGHVSMLPRVADLDGFYHLGHAMAYLEGSLLDTSLPWATRSVIADYGADLWWGFHVILLPFAALGDVALGLHLAGAALTLGLGLTVWWVLRRHGVAVPGVWAALFLVAVPNVFFRHLMVRPHVISLAASLALLSVLVRGRWWQVALSSALISWVHLSLAWMAPALAVAYGIVRIPVTVAVGVDGPDTGVSIRRAVPAAVLGTFAGWVLRPEPIATAALLNVQLFELFALQATGVPVTFAAELDPIGAFELVRMSGLFALAWVGALAVAVHGAVHGRLQWLGQARVTLVATALVVSAVFLVLALFSARRAMEQWVSFGFLAMPLLWPLVRGWVSEPEAGAPVTHAPRTGAAAVDAANVGGEAVAAGPPSGFRGRPAVHRAAVRVAGVVLLVVHLAWGAWRHWINVELVAFPDAALREVSEFLEERSAPGEIVFHARWDNFGPLFAHNRANRYLGGMDPVFFYAHDPRSYWEFLYLSADASTELTCDAYPCAQGMATDTYDALREHFGARWVLVEPRRNPLFALYLLDDPRYALALETQREALFEIIAPGSDSGAGGPELRPEPDGQ
jgi:hypothetical protein